MATETTKACNLTEAEVLQLMAYHGYNMGEGTEEKMERLKYLAGRLKAFRDDNGDKQPKAEIPVAASLNPAPTSW